MKAKLPGRFDKLMWSLPWLARYPFSRVNDRLRRAREQSVGTQHLIFTIANHFEPSWSESGGLLDLDTQMTRLDHWCEQARSIGRAVLDSDGTPFRHTNFYPAEQYHRPLLERLAELEGEGFGEVEIHLHHGVEHPDVAANLRGALEEFRDRLAEDHHCLSRMEGSHMPMYAFVHGNFALANSAGGKYCGVDEEMQILAETGCYADLTLPSAPDRSQVPRLNAIYECGHPLHEAKPHRSGPSLRVGHRPQLPVLLTGPIGFDWGRRKKGLPVPRLDDSSLSANYPPSLARLDRWRAANIHVRGRPEWLFIKLFCHGFFDSDPPTVIGDVMRRFLEETLELAERTGEFKLHFASARESFNIAMAAVDGLRGDPHLYRDYLLHSIRKSQTARQATSEIEHARV
ncbi:MAG TPA: hypothetical protein VGN95_13860 [Pyrinomonadaceae bacterium]|nr:hypothetical protein [Pyrinomonadaceae bacterium]